MNIKNIKLSEIFTAKNLILTLALGVSGMHAYDELEDRRVLSACEAAEQIHRLAGRVEYNADQGGIHPYAFDTMQRALETQYSPTCL